ncbi:thioredoxin domain-containing protein [Acidobacteriota bacterium]|nr:thioredoxin domain-containing protein [Acidobacteriota bacterium]
MPNRLSQSLSPYLIQHANNPVDWYPWSEEALAKARSENKPIFLSIGYSACHWCHVMEHESFENDEVATVLNRGFVSIKVDREERPDLDDLYMDAVQLITRRGGWPMSVWLTPDLKPFFGGTYFPREPRQGMPGFIQLLENIEVLWSEKSKDLKLQADELVSEMKKMSTPEGANVPLDSKGVDQAIKQLAQEFDEEWGGFGSAPKFPQQMAIDLIFKHNGAAYQAMAFKTLDAMWEGGLFDHLAGGFARYSTDRRWLVPHFEKMLYDNAQLASIYFDGYMRSGQPGYRVIAEETLDYLLNDMADPGGGIYSSEDADSEGVEGKFYVFTQEEIEKCLGADAKVFMRVYGVTPQGNFEEHNILHRFTGRGGAQLDKEKEKSCKEKLLRYRNQRIRPHRDDKILASWNGLALSAFAKGYRVTNRKIYLNQAHKIADFVMRELWDGSNLYRVYRKGQRHTLGFSEDYAFVANGLIDLYEANHDEQRLYQAQALVECLVSKFYDQELGGFYSNDPQRSDTLFSIKNVYDQAIPSPNSQALKALLRLSRYFNQTTYLQMIEQSFKVCGKWLEQRPRAMLGMLSVLDNYLKPSLEIIMVGDPEHPLIVGALASLNQKYLPQLSLIVGPSGALPHYQGRQGLPNEASIYICEGQTCSIPLSRLEEFNKLIEKY